MTAKKTNWMDRDEAGSIEQHLDMIEGGGPRGDEILHHKGHSFEEEQRPELTEDSMLLNYHEDMADPNREGDEMSGDEHSLGLQGGESELEDQPNASSGLPGEETEKDKEIENRLSQS